MLTVRDLLKTKGDEIWAVSPETSTLDALRFMTSKNVGALLVLEDGILSGIITERDFVFRISSARDCLLEAPIRELMTSKVITVTPETTLDQCMHMMTDRRIRHLPVFDGERLAGLISIGDVVKGLLGEQNAVINNLENYIEGRGYGQ